jgi:hypothetical protein
MKAITNWRNATVADTEANGLLREASRLHILSFKMKGKKLSSLSGADLGRWNKMFDYHIDNGIPLVGHNFICFDVPLWEKILGRDLSELMVIDTLMLSWYLNVKREIHGLGSFLDDYGVAKPEQEDWIGIGEVGHQFIKDHLAKENPTLEDTIRYEKLLAEHEAFYCDMETRCEGDTKINTYMWVDFQGRLVDMYTRAKAVIDQGLVGGKRVSDDEVIYIDQYRDNSTVDEYINRILTFLMFKCDTIRLREKTGILVDEPYLDDSIKKVTKEVTDARNILEAKMPVQPVYTYKKKPVKPYLKDGVTLSKSGISWNEKIAQLNANEKDSLGHPKVKLMIDDPDRIKILSKYDAPNAGGHAQIKSYLFSKGWIPETFKIVVDREATDAYYQGGCKGQKPIPRKVPQINVEKDKVKHLCPSVVKLIAANPELQAYDKFTTITSRMAVLVGIKESMYEGRVHASSGGVTNTLRDKHRKPICNLPSEDTMYGSEIRGSLIAGKGKKAAGADLSGLEDRAKHHFMIPHDPEYVKTMMSDNYDAHITMALTANMITVKEFDDFMKGIKPPLHVKAARGKGKTTNYASVYLAAAATIARAAGVPLAEGKILFEAYWKLNWSVKVIAEEQIIITDDTGIKWLVNPVNGLCYWLKAEKDRFSTLCQGTGSFFFDCWIDGIITRQVRREGFATMSLLVHDEFMRVIDDTEEARADITEDASASLEDVNNKYLLRRKLGYDIQFGDSYVEIH